MGGDSRGMHISKIWGQKAVDFEQLTIDATAGGIALTPTKYANARSAKFGIEAADIRMRVDGGVPTSTLGQLGEDGDWIEIDTKEDLVNFKAIRTGSVSAVVNVTYYE